MGQASSHEKKRRGKKGGNVNVAVDENEAPRRKPSVSKNGKRNSRKGHRKPKKVNSKDGQTKEQQQKPLQTKKNRPGSIELIEGSDGAVIYTDNLDSPRYGIFDDLKPTVCIEEDGVSLSSVSSDEDTAPIRAAPSKTAHRSSSRRLRRTYSSGRRRSRAARMAKKHKAMAADKVNRENAVEKVTTETKTETSQTTEKEKYLLSADDSAHVMSGDDSGCSTLEDHLFPDDSLSEEVLGCLVTRGMEFDSDASSHQSLTPIVKSRRDEGYESLQKLTQSPNETEEIGASVEDVRQLILSSSTVTHDSSVDTGMDMSQWTLRRLSLSEEDRLSFSVDSEHADSADMSNEKSSNADSFSDSGYSSKTKLSECETETTEKLQSSGISMEDSQESIDWLEETPACVDDSFNAHFAKVMMMPKTTIFYQGRDKSELRESKIRVEDSKQSPIPCLRQLSAAASIESEQSAGVTVKESEAVDSSVTLRSSPEPEKCTCICLGEKRGPANPSEVYV